MSRSKSTGTRAQIAAGRPFGTRETRPDVLHVVTLASRTGAYGGPLDTALEQMKIAFELGCVPRLMAGTIPGDEPRPFHPEILALYIPVRPLVPGGGFATLCSASLVRKLWAAVGNSDIVHVHFAREIIPTLAALFAVLRSKRLVLQPHGMLTVRSSPKHRLVDLLTKPLYGRADTVMALTSEEERQLRAWSSTFRGDYVVCGNPVADHPYARERTVGETVAVAFIARLHPRKNVTTFLQAASICAEQPQLDFVVVGPDEGELDKVLAAADSLDHLRYLGAVDATRVREILNKVTVFVLTSSNEPWGNVLATAISMGVPVVLTKSSALSLVVAEHGAGEVVADGDAASLAAAVRRLITEPALYAERSRNALRLSNIMLNRDAFRACLSTLYGTK